MELSNRMIPRVLLRQLLQKIHCKIAAGGGWQQSHVQKQREYTTVGVPYQVIAVAHTT